ncbi:MAG: ATP-binding protein [Prevotellaceae bacterium]|jgi:hypothetical protein|nr:ATP-binding protein [Prevotellaceae bacterium]
MGPQSSGKSTIAKIISYCTWVEKDVATSQSLKAYLDNKNYFVDRLESFYKLNGYFKNPDRSIFYQSDVVEIAYSADDFSIKWRNRYAYQRSKISYIPSERNMIILPEVKKVTFDSTNIRSFMFDWFDEKKSYPKEKALPILDLGLAYYYDKDADEDHILHTRNGASYDILLSSASSGLQAITPLVVTVDFLTGWFYKQDESLSFEVLEEKIRKTNQILREELLVKKYFGNDAEADSEKISAISEKISAGDAHALELLKAYDKVRKMLFSTHNTQLIIEEPEQNLFPEAQRNLAYYLLDKISSEAREHTLTITTHSPYILYALNNCMLGGLVGKKMKAPDREKLKCKNSFINPRAASIYELHDGVLKSIQQDDGLISANYFDAKMKELMDDFYVMLNYYEE